MGRMSVEEKVNQISAQLLYMNEFYQKRDYTRGHVRNVGHFLPDGNLPNDPKSVTDRINEDTRRSIESAAAVRALPLLFFARLCISEIILIFAPN